MNTSKSLALHDILLTHFEPTCGTTCLQSHFDEDLARAEAAIVEAVEGLAPPKKVPGVGLSKLSEWNYNGYNQAVDDFLQAIKEWQ